MIAVIDYGAGNLFSVGNALDFLGLGYTITDNQAEIERCQSIILPGVGAFPDAMSMLINAGLAGFLKEQAQKKPFLGICIGAQLLFQKGLENTQTDGLAIIEGVVRKINAPGYKIPHMGWNSLINTRESHIVDGVSENACTYFVHSYIIDTPEENIVSYCEYGEKIPAVVQKGSVYGVQFHPEKSGAAGLRLLENFGRMK